MDSLRTVDAEDGIDPAAEAHDAATDAGEPHPEPPPSIGVDERRMHVRAYNYWVSLLGNRLYPSIEDLDPAKIEDFGAHSVLLDFTEGPADPAIAFLGKALREEGGHEADVARISCVPSGSLVSRLTDHYMEILANRAPVGFEAEYVNRRGRTTLYRGILMPFSSDDDTIDFLYGVINWKELAEPALNEALCVEVAEALRSAPAPTAPAAPVWADGPGAMPEALPEAAFEPVLEGDAPGDAPVEHRAGVPSGEGPPHHILADEGFAIYGDGEDPSLGDRLADAREGAEIVRRAEGRGRAALYRALSLAYDFALLADARPDDYAELLADSGIKMQPRAPLTPLVKLVFGADYDRTRLAEFAAALSWGFRRDVALGGLRAEIEAFPGALKGLIAAERQARRGPVRPAPGVAAREKLRSAVAQATVHLGPVDADFVLLVARREADGALAVLAPVSDEALVDRAIRKLAA